MKTTDTYKPGNTQKPFLHLLVLLVAGLAVYSNTFSVPFLFDDGPNIVENDVIKNLRHFTDFSAFLYNRSLVAWTFALNYQLHGLNVAGYHAVNLAIHITNALLVYRLVTGLFHTPFIASAGESQLGKPNINIMAFGVSFLFLCHPVQTGAVTYIVQRFTLLATLFYLASMVLYLAARSSIATDGSWRSVKFTGLYSASLACTLLAMKCKEIAFTLPVMIVIAELFFHEASLKQRICLMFPFLAALAIIPLSLLLSSEASDSMLQQLNYASQQTVLISRSDYLLTQLRVIVTYIRLMLLPVGQNIDYDYPVYSSLFQIPVLASLAFHAVNISLAFVLFSASKREKRYLRLAAFSILWFYVTLSVESSFIPIDDVIFEHRVYLPSIGFLLLAVTGFSFLAEKWSNRHARIIWIFVIVAGIAIAGAAFVRNQVWQSEIQLWQDALLKSPLKSRPHNNLGLALKAQGNLAAAIAEHREAVRLGPGYKVAHVNLGSALQNSGDLEGAIQAYLAALRIDPDYKEAHYNLGTALQAKGSLTDAISAYRESIRLNPDNKSAYINLGVIFAELGNIDAAIEQFREAVRIAPHYSFARHNLDVALEQKKRQDSIRKQ